MNTEEIKNIIPHRHPFLLIDRVESMDAGKEIVGLKNVTWNEPFFQGHFPSEPVMPGVLILEALAQAGAVLILSMEAFEGKTAYLSGTDKVRFYKKVVPGDTLILKVEFVSKRGNFVKLAGQAELRGDKCAVAEMVCAVESHSTF